MFFSSLHSSKRKFATVQYVNRERFLFPYLHSLFVICSSALATRTVFCSLFVRSLFVHCSFIVRLFFVHCSSFLRSLFVFCSFIVRHLFVICSSFVYLPVVLRLLVWLAPACRATTSHRH